jgi:hypothetical protein
MAATTTTTPATIPTHVRARRSLFGFVESDDS